MACLVLRCRLQLHSQDKLRGRCVCPWPAVKIQPSLHSQMGGCSAPYLPKSCKQQSGTFTLRTAPVYMYSQRHRIVSESALEKTNRNSHTHNTAKLLASTILMTLDFAWQHKAYHHITANHERALPVAGEGERGKGTTHTADVTGCKHCLQEVAVCASILAGTRTTAAAACRWANRWYRLNHRNLEL